MRLHFAHIPAQSPAEAEAELNGFLASHRVTAIDRQLVTTGPTPFWAISVTWLEDRAFVDPKRGDRPDYRELLPEAEFTVFARLRAARKAWAERDGVPPYAVFTNEQLAAIAQRRVTSLAALGDIAGVGKAKLDKYGRDVLALVHEATAAEAEATAAGPLPESRPQPSASQRPAGRGP